jgi:hypothetical protein
MPAVQHYRKRYCRRVVGDLPDDLQPEDMDVLGVLKSRVARAVATQSSAAEGTPTYRLTPRWNGPGSPPSSRLQSVKRERSFHLGINKVVERAARSFDRYASCKAAMASAIRTEQPALAQEQRSPATYDAYAVGHGGGVAAVPDHHTNLSVDPDRRALQWDAVEEHERSLRPNCAPGPPRIAIHYQRAPELFDAAAVHEGCPSGLRDLIRKEQQRVASGRLLSTRDAKLGVAWIDETAPAAQAWLERQPGWDADGHKDRRLSRLSAGRGVLTHVSGEIEYPAILASKPEARQNIRTGLAAWLESERNARDKQDDGRILPMAIFDHLPDRLNDSLRLFLPESWTSDPERMAKAKVPADRQVALTKPEIAIEEIDRIRAAGVRFACVLADAGYGMSAPFRQALSARSLSWTVGIPGRQKVYPADVAMIFPVAGHGRPRQHHIPDSKSLAAEKLLAEQAWRSVSWRRGTKGRLSSRFAAIRVRVADGPTQRIRDMGGQHLPGEEVWLVGEHRSTGERKYYLSNLPAGASICEQAHQQLKEELGLDHFEGRSWTGIHRHALMTMIAYAFLQSRRLTAAGRKKKSLRTSPAAHDASRPTGDPQHLRQATTDALPPLP